MARISEQISKANTSSQGKTDSNLANDSLHLGGIAAEDYARKKYVQEYHDNKEEKLRQDMIDSDEAVLEEAKEYANSQIRNQDFSGFAKTTDVQALDKKLSEGLTEGLNAQKNYTDKKTQAIVDDVNANFSEVEGAIGTLNGTVEELFTSVSNGKSEIAGAITDKGVSTSADDSFSTMANNISQIQSGGGGEVVVPPGYYDTSDATVTPYDILTGKTAYGATGKIEGVLSIDESSGKPSYDIGAVEKIYADNGDTVYLTESTGINEYNIVDFSILRNSTNNDIEAIYMLERNSDSNDLYLKTYVYDTSYKIFANKFEEKLSDTIGETVSTNITIQSFFKIECSDYYEGKANVAIKTDTKIFVFPVKKEKISSGDSLVKTQYSVVNSIKYEFIYDTKFRNKGILKFCKNNNKTFALYEINVAYERFGICFFQLLDTISGEYIILQKDKKTISNSKVTGSNIDVGAEFLFNDTLFLIKSLNVSILFQINTNAGILCYGTCDNPIVVFDNGNKAFSTTGNVYNIVYNIEQGNITFENDEISSVEIPAFKNIDVPLGYRLTQNNDGTIFQYTAFKNNTSVTPYKVESIIAKLSEGNLITEINRITDIKYIKGIKSSADLRCFILATKERISIDNLTTYISEIEQDYSELIALKYQGELYYKSQTTEVQ